MKNSLSDLARTRPTSRAALLTSQRLLPTLTASCKREPSYVRLEHPLSTADEQRTQSLRKEECICWGTKRHQKIHINCSDHFLLFLLCGGARFAKDLLFPPSPNFAWFPTPAF
jgi:hypothetical protein